MAPGTLATGLTRLAAAEAGGILHITFTASHIDGATVRELYETVALRVTGSHVRLLVDFTGVEMVNSGLMGMLVTVKKRCMSEGAQFHVALPAEELRRAFELMNLHLILAIFPTPHQALQRFKPA
jgi:anti-sigma B factor antagonist